MTSSFISRQKPSTIIAGSSNPPDTETELPTTAIGTTATPVSLLQVVDDWKNGIIPSNDTINHYIEELNASPLLIEDYKLSSSGKKLVKDIKDLTSLLEDLLTEKNKDELLQKFIAHLRLSSKHFQSSLHNHHVKEKEKSLKPKITVGPRIHSRRQVMSEYQKRLEKESVEALPLISLLISSEDFQNILIDSQTLMERIFKTGKDVNRHEDQHHHQHHSSSTTSPSGAIHDIDDLEYGIQETKTHLDKIWKNEFDSKSLPTTDGFKEEIIFPKIQKIPHSRDEDHNSILSDLKRIILQLKGEHVISLEKGWKILFNWGIDDLIGLAMPAEIKYDANFEASRTDFIKILECLSNGTSLNPLLENIEKFQKDCKTDYELRDFFKDWSVFIETCIKDHPYMNHPEFYNRGGYLLTKTDELLEERYRSSFNEASFCTKALMKGLKEDPQTHLISTKVKTIISDDLYLHDRLRKEIITDFKNVFIPNIMNSLSNTQLPQIEIENKDGKVLIEDVVVPSSLFEMSNMTLKTDGVMHLFEGGKFLQKPDAKNPALHVGTSLRMKGMKGEIKNVRFKIAKKTFPALKDSGYCDIRLGGKGMEIKIDLDTNIDSAPNEGNTLLEAVKVTVKVDKIRLRFRNVKHSIILSIFKPYIQSQIRGDLEKGVCDSLSKGLGEMNKLVQYLTRTIEFAS